MQSISATSSAVQRNAEHDARLDYGVESLDSVQLPVAPAAPPAVLRADQSEAWWIVACMA